MPSVGQRERETQNRVLAFFKERLGYSYLGNWKDRAGNDNVEAGLLSAWLKRQGHDEAIAGKAVAQLRKARVIAGGKGLYDANRDVYEALRYGLKVLPETGDRKRTVWPIDWKDPENNDFAIAEEVSYAGTNAKRPDLVLYVNGIALGVIELKRSSVSVTEGIRQNLDNQKPDFIQDFFTTVQLVMAGNETEGLRYGVIDTREKYYLRWKEPGGPFASEANALLCELGQLCGKARLLEIIHDFIVFDAGRKKTCRHNQYFGVRAAQERLSRREGGIIWHTQGSGKSLTMVWLAKWIREHIPGARVLLITDRTELDDQIEKVFKGVNEEIWRTKSGADLSRRLAEGDKWLLCSLIHKFGSDDEPSADDVSGFVSEFSGAGPGVPAGEFFVFVDECHRSQSGRLHDAMQALLPDATFIGFTGTPLLAQDKHSSIHVFGSYIHTYKYDEAVHDGVVLDLRYEARDIDQSLLSQGRVDEWFEIQTRGMNDYARARVKQRWGTMQKVLSSRDRLSRIVADILMDMERRERLASGHGNALLVSDSIHSACRFYQFFQETPLKDHCAIVTSFDPSPSAIKGEESGEGPTERLLQYEVYRRMLADYFRESEDKAQYRVAEFESRVKKTFIEEPGRMKLLIVVDKLLTGFDAPPATYLYIDKQMRDHGLFQAICRVNRLDGDDKEYGYIVDYKDLFKSLEQSIKDYTGEAFDGYDDEDIAGLLSDRLDKGRQRLEDLRESIKALCEPVPDPRGTLEYCRYFSAADSGDLEAVKKNAPLRVQLYKLTASLVRAYADLAGEMGEAGYTDREARIVQEEAEHFQKVCSEVKLHSGDYVDMKALEPAMRYLLDTYIRAEESVVLSSFDDLSLVQLIVERGEDAIDALPPGLRDDGEAAAETIENNVRRIIVDRTDVNPRYFEKMSELLDGIIASRRRQAGDYKDYLKHIVELTRRVAQGGGTDYPSGIDTPARRALYDNLECAAEDCAEYRARLAVELDRTIRDVKKADFRDSPMKQKEVRLAMERVLGSDDPEYVARLFDIVKSQHEY